jgi:hypothetical protein
LPSEEKVVTQLADPPETAALPPLQLIGLPPSKKETEPAPTTPFPGLVTLAVRVTELLAPAVKDGFCDELKDVTVPLSAAVVMIKFQLVKDTVPVRPLIT